MRQQSRQRFVQSELSVGVAGNIESEFELHVNRFKVVGSCVILRVEGGRQNRSRAVAVVQVYRQRIYRKSQGIIADFDRQSYRGGAEILVVSVVYLFQQPQFSHYAKLQIEVAVHGVFD